MRSLSLHARRTVTEKKNRLLVVYDGSGAFDVFCDHKAAGGAGAGGGGAS